MSRRSPLSWKPPKLVPRVDFRPNDFRKLQFTHGSLMVWQKSQPCACTNLVGVTPLSDEQTATEEANDDCPTCGGKGYFYRDAQEITAVIIGASRNPVFYQLYGERARGMASITLEPEHMASAWDRFTVLGDKTGKKTVIQNREVRQREGDTERLRYPIVTTLLDTGLSELEQTVLDPTENDGVVIARVDWLGRMIPTILEFGVDYQVTADGDIEWLGDVGVASEGQFIVRGVPGCRLPARTWFRYDDDLDFVTMETVEIGADGQAVVTMRCVTEGEIGNIDDLGFEVEIKHSIEGIEDAAECQLGTQGGVDGNVPPLGGRYTVTYWAHPVYVVQDVPHMHRDTRIAFKKPGGTEWDRMVYQVHCWLETMGPPHGYLQDVTA